MPSMNDNLGPNPSGPLRSVLRPVLHALVAYGWMWIPGLPPRELFGSSWPYENAGPARVEERATATLSRP
ncbi:hypothetical protein AAW14_27440 [Streptomyces hygroscopicus]|nr:hypothetical protein [Streptomyces hygroscopicus]